MALLAAAKNKNMAEWSDFLKRCQVFMQAEFKVLFELAQTKQWSDLDELLEAEEVKKERQQEIKSVLSGLKERNKILDIWSSLETFLKLDRDEVKSQDYYFGAQKLKNQLEKGPFKYIQKLGLIALAIRMDNEAWAQKELNEFLNFHPARISFEVHRGVFTDEWNRERFEKMMLEIGLVIGNFFKDREPLKTDIFMTLMDEGLSSRTFRSLSSNYQIQWSLSRLRSSISSGERVSHYPSFWYSQLSHRTSRGQVDVFINSLFEKEVVDDLSYESLWIFTETMPSEESKRHKIRDVVLEQKDKDPYQRFITLELLEHEALKRMLGEKRRKWKKPIFQLKRSLYQEIFWQESAPELMLFLLLELGDYNDDYLWAFAYPGTLAPLK